MKIDRVLAIAACVLSLLAIGMSVRTMRHDAFGTDLSSYNLSSPEQTLQSVNQMVARQDVRAGWELFKTLLQADSSPETKLFLSDDVKVTVVKSIEVADSSGPKNKGLIVSFVRFNVSGVDYHTVQYFRKDASNRFLLGEAFYVPYGAEKTAQDKQLEAAIAEFKTTGKV
jgi:hypothetical protein